MYEDIFGYKLWQRQVLTLYCLIVVVFLFVFCLLSWLLVGESLEPASTAVPSTRTARGYSSSIKLELELYFWARSSTRKIFANAEQR